MHDPKRILVLAPHTDDGELGCGGTIARFCEEGREVFYAAFCLCSKSLPSGYPPDTLEKECRVATASLGIKSSNLMLFDYEVRNLPQHRQTILDELIKLGKDIQPEMVFLPASSDIHQDHQLVNQEGLRAFKYASVAGYELPWNNHRFHTSFFVHLSAAQITRKINALKLYQSQAHRNYMNEEFTRSLARVRGVQCNSEFAEAFEIYKLIV